MTSDIQARVFATIKEILMVDMERISLETSVRDDLARNSLDQMTLFMALEDEFNGAISDDDVDKINTVGDIVTYIETEMVLSKGS